MLYAIPFGLLVGLAIGGRIQNLAAARLRLVPAMALALALQVALFTPLLGDTAWVAATGPLLYVGSLALLMAALAANLRGRSAWLVLVGAASNLLVIVVNGGRMPVDADAVRQLRGEAAVEALRHGGSLSNVALITDQTYLPFLGDVLALPRLLPLANAVSVGDLLVGVGVALWVAEWMRPPRGL